MGKMTELICLNCGNISTIIRGDNHLKTIGHIKDLWCYKCKDTTKHFELRDKSTFYYDDSYDELSNYVKSILWPDEYRSILNSEDVKKLVLNKRK